MNEEKIKPLFEPDVLIRDQYWETARQHNLEPEKKLMLGVLENALWTYKKYVFSRKAIFFDVEHWFFDAKRNEFFSFKNICEALGLSPDCIRRRLLAWKALEPVRSYDLTLNPNVKKRQPHRNLDDVHSLASPDGRTQA